MIVETLSVVCSVLMLPVSLTVIGRNPENEASCMMVMGIKVKVNLYIELYNPFLELENLSRG